jgi:hypothetical protein
MDKRLLAGAGIDYGEGAARFGGAAALYEKYLLKFPNDPTFPALKDAMEKGDAQAAFDKAHALKGLTGNLSLNALYGSTKPLVEALRGGDMELARRLYPEVEKEYLKVLAALGC